MLDSLAITLALLSSPVARPDMEHNVTIIAPVQVASIHVARKGETVNDDLTTCFENNAGSCWGKD